MHLFIIVLASLTLLVSLARLPSPVFTQMEKIHGFFTEDGHEADTLPYDQSKSVSWPPRLDHGVNPRERSVAKAICLLLDHIDQTHEIEEIRSCSSH